MDAFDYLKEFKQKAIITSLPDMDEINMDIPEWTKWITRACIQLAAALDDDGIIFFYQTNRKHKGYLIDKSWMITNCFYFLGYKKIHEKIVLKQKVNTVSLFRPAHSKIFSFSKKLTSGKGVPEVFDTGKMLYKNAMGYNAAKSCVNYIKKHVDTDTILDPFCGQGSVLKIANDMGMNAIGIDILKEQCKLAKKL